MGQIRKLKVDSGELTKKPDEWPGFFELLTVVNQEINLFLRISKAIVEFRYTTKRW